MAAFKKNLDVKIPSEHPPSGGKLLYLVNVLFIFKHRLPGLRHLSWAFVLQQVLVFPTALSRLAFLFAWSSFLSFLHTGVKTNANANAINNILHLTAAIPVISANIYGNV